MKFTTSRLSAFTLPLCAAAILLGGIGSAQAVNSYNRSPDTVYDDTYKLRTVSLQGSNQRRSEWFRMDSTNYSPNRHGSGYPGGPWNSPLPPNATFGPDNTARLYKGTVAQRQSALSGHLSSMGIYTAMSQTPFMVYESNPVADLHTVVFQIYATTGSDPIPSSWEDVYGQDGDLSKAPVLKLLDSNGDWHNAPLAPASELYESRYLPFSHIPVEEDVEGGGEDAEEGPVLMFYENYRSYNWDLSAVPYQIVSFAVEFELYAHVNMRSISIDQAGGLIPEPAHIAALLSLVLLSGILLRRRPQ